MLCDCYWLVLVKAICQPLCTCVYLATLANKTSPDICGELDLSDFLYLELIPEFRNKLGIPMYK